MGTEPHVDRAGRWLWQTPRLLLAGLETARRSLLGQNRRAAARFAAAAGEASRRGAILERGTQGSSARTRGRVALTSGGSAMETFTSPSGWSLESNIGTDLTWGGLAR